ncbi:hypothetical protein G4228_015011 [Cervus hanglu yarkandensis]|nr:hypothetical protein G4228_015011 [Cervus hanglu yarkandensis]
MKLLLLVFTALGFLVTPARGGGTICGRKIAGHCKLKCGSLEKTMFMCDRYKQCCVKGLFIAKSVMQPPIQNPNKPHRKYTVGQTKDQWVKQ